MTASNALYTQKDLVDMLFIPQQTLSRQLPDTGYYIINTGTERKVKAYPLSVLPENIKRQVIAIELKAQPETPLEVAAKRLPAPQAQLKDWQREVCKARLLVLDYVNTLGIHAFSGSLHILQN